MNIGELARRSGLAPSAIRYYERTGLLPPAARGSNGYRAYGEATLEQLKVIGIGQNLGFSLDAIRGVLKLEGDVLMDALMESMARRLAEIDTMALALAAQRASILQTMQEVRDEELTSACLKPATQDRYNRSSRPQPYHGVEDAFHLIKDSS